MDVYEEMELEMEKLKQENKCMATDLRLTRKAWKATEEALQEARDDLRVAEKTVEKLEFLRSYDEEDYEDLEGRYNKLDESHGILLNQLDDLQEEHKEQSESLHRRGSMIEYLENKVKSLSKDLEIAQESWSETEKAYWECEQERLSAVKDFEEALIAIGEITSDFNELEGAFIELQTAVGTPFERDFGTTDIEMASMKDLAELRELSSGALDEALLYINALDSRVKALEGTEKLWNENPSINIEIDGKEMVESLDESYQDIVRNFDSELKDSLIMDLEKQVKRLNDQLNKQRKVSERRKKHIETLNSNTTAKNEFVRELLEDQRDVRKSLAMIWDKLY